MIESTARTRAFAPGQRNAIRFLFSALFAALCLISGVASADASDSDRDGGPPKASDGGLGEALDGAGGDVVAPVPAFSSDGGAASDAAIPEAPVPAAAAVEAAPTAPAAAVSPEVVAAADGGPANALDTVVVTARYRAEDAQDVPIPMTTLSSDQLKDLGGTFNLKQIVYQLPSLNIQGYSGRNQTITIRGLGTNAGSTNDGLEQGVGLYIDGVYRPRTGSAITDLVDVESIQVLRGPQGTLFGKNTVAGAVDIRTAEPSFQRSIKAEFSYGNYDYYRIYFSLTEPINDELTFRVSYLRSARDGWTFNTSYNSYWDNLSNDALRADILYKPSDRFKTRLIADYSMQTCNCGFNLLGQALPTTLANGKVVKGFAQHAADVGYIPIAIDPFARRTDIDSSQADKMPSWGIQNRADWRLQHDLSLTSITAYRNWKWLPNFDGDQFGANVSPEGIVETHQQQFSQEVRLASPGGQTLDYTAGLYYFWQQPDDYQYSSYGTQASGWLVSPTTPSAVLNNLVSFSHVVPTTSSAAAYGQTTWHITPAWHATAGLRYTFENKTGSYNASAQGNPTPIADLPASSQATAGATRAAFAPSGSYRQSLNSNNLSWTFILAHDFSDDIHTFATYSRGYKSPGINLVRQTLGVNVFVNPETVDDFELGTKADFFGGRVEINPNLFWMIDNNYQANYINTNVAPLAAYITNVGTVLSRGVELDARVAPVEGLSGSFSLVYDDAVYQSYKNAPAQYLYSYLGTQDLSGQRASGVPRWSASAALEYRAPVGHLKKGEKLEAYVGADWSLRSGFFAAVNLDPFSWVPGYELFGANAGIRNGHHWDLSLWVRNLLNENYYNTLSVSGTYGVTLASIGDPRTVGATLRGEL